MARVMYTLLVLALVVVCALGRPSDKRPGGRPDQHPGGRPDKHPGGGRSDQHPGGRPDKHPGGRPDKRPWGRPKPPYEGDYEKGFFCQIANKVCRLEAGDGSLLVDRECPGGTSCDDGASAMVTLGANAYNVTFCPQLEPGEIDPIQIAIDAARRPEPSAALVEICGEVPKKPDDRYSLWYRLACRVTENGEDLSPERRCRKGVECSKGPYEAQLGSKTVQATFCNYTFPPRSEGEEGEEKETQPPFWYRAACQVVTTDGAVVKPQDEDGCPRNLSCSVRLSDMDHEGDQKVNVSFCDGVLLSRPGGRPGFRPGSRPAGRPHGRPDRG